MKIGFISEWSLSDPSQRSGVPYSIYQAFLKNDYEVNAIEITATKRSLFFKLKSKVKTVLYNQFFTIYLGNYFFQYSSEYFQLFSDQIKKSLADDNVDILFSINSFSFTFNPSNLPKIVWIDNTFFTYYHNYDLPSISGKRYRKICSLEKKSLTNCDHIVCTSNWLKNEIIEKYNISSDKINVVPRGANLTSNFSEKEILNAIKRRNNQPLKLLFIGRNWQLKGGDIAFQVCEALILKGIELEFSIVGKINGCELNFNNYDWIKRYDSFSLSDSQDKQTINDLFSNAHFLLVPSRADGFGIVFAEAATFGTPSIALDIMGVENSVINNITGKRFNEEDAVTSITNYIFETYNNPELYNQLCLSAYRYSNEHFNWNKNVKKVVQTCL